MFRDCEEKDTAEYLICPKMVVIPKGEFLMGSPLNEKRRDNDEGPQRTVEFRNLFAVGKFELTFAEWDACVAAGGCTSKPNDQGWGRGNRPVINVSWKDSKDYVSWLSRKTGKVYRLLSEAEWEYAARSETTTRYSFGETILREQAQFLVGHNGSIGTVEVGSFRANKFGLHDMHGNVWE